MLAKCMLNPLKLARLMEWQGRLGKPSAIMTIDITNHQIGIALAYHRQQALPQDADTNENGHADNVATTTSLIALPPIPYMSSEPYHPSYAFLHRPQGKNAIRSLDRVERTMEVVDQLAQLAIDRKVKGILVRWPGDLASAVSGRESHTESPSRDAEEGQLLFPADANRRNRNEVGNTKSDGSMGYMRGRILHVLDAACSSHGHNKSSVPSEPFLMQGLRPFALCDTSVSEQKWILFQQQNTHLKPIQPRLPKRRDDYGNSFAEKDQWGRAAIFGNQPPQPQQGKFHHSSKQKYVGYRVRSQFGSEGSLDGKGERELISHNNFDSFHDNETVVNQFRGSFSAMHTLHDFVEKNLQGRITLPSWATATSASGSARKEQIFDQGHLKEKYDEGDLGCRTNSRRNQPSLMDAKKPTAIDIKNSKSSSSNLRVGTSGPTALNKKTTALASLVQLPKRKRRQRGKH